MVLKWIEKYEIHGHLQTLYRLCQTSDSESGYRKGEKYLGSVKWNPVDETKTGI